MDVCSGFGSLIQTSCTFDLAAVSTDGFLSLDFAIADAVSDCEIRLIGCADACGKVSGIEFHYLQVSENLLNRWSGDGLRPTELADHLTASLARVDRIEARLLGRSGATFGPEAFSYPPLREGDFLEPRLFADRKHMVSSLRPGAHTAVAEIGVAFGEFSEFLIQTLKPLEFHAYDLFDMHEYEYIWGQRVTDVFGNLDHVEFYKKRLKGRGAQVFAHQGLTSVILPLAERNKFDLIYVDAGHYYNDVRNDAHQAARMIRDDGIIIFNDYLMFDHFASVPYGVVRGVNEFIAEGEWKVVGFALQQQMFCDIAVSRVRPKWRD